MTRKTPAKERSSPLQSLTGGEDGPREEFERRVVEYLHEIKRLGIVDSVILGIDEKEACTYIVNVLKDDVDIATLTDPRYNDLSDLGGLLEEKLERILTLQVTYANPSKVNIVKSKMRAQGIKLECLKLKDL